MIRPYRASDKEPILQLLAEVWNLAAAQATRARWSWLFEDNPFTDLSQENILVYESQNQVLGALLAFAFPMQVRGRKVTAFCLVDFVVAKQARGAGAALAKAMTNLPHFYIGTPNPAALALWRLLGCLEYSVMVSRVAVLDLAGLLKHRKSPKALSWMGGVLWSSLTRLLSPRRRLPGFQIVEVTELDARFDQLWASLEDFFPTSVIRDARYLHWRFRQRPDGAYRLLTAEREGKLLGYAVLSLSERWGVRRGFLVDLLVPPDREDVLSELIARTIEILRMEGVILVHCALGHFPDCYHRTLSRHGFYFVRPGAAVVGYSRSPEVPLDFVQGASPWFLTGSLGEMDFVN